MKYKSGTLFINLNIAFFMQIPLANTLLYHFHSEHFVNHIWQSFMRELKKLNDNTGLSERLGEALQRRNFEKTFVYCLQKVMSFSTFSEQ